MEQHAGELVVEFTEETEMGDVQLKELKNSFAKMNIETDIDDYGSGYSNVNNLLRYMPRNPSSTDISIFGWKPTEPLIMIFLLIPRAFLTLMLVYLLYIKAAAVCCAFDR